MTLKSNSLKSGRVVLHQFFRIQGSIRRLGWGRASSRAGSLVASQRRTIPAAAPKDACPFSQVVPYSP